ncbi:SGNH/GDSL hydrolase family protein [Apilactobacillus micheneri]|uniref:SGNH/GDSL hydrolase family protein n=2 Tax=Apilactobacillus micheneri TaxID=1899430 RepID=A0ABY2YXU1_9LACO|nr:SGNH/GDSL hydrolase family protein [Apilactobacillus micheneri]TPR26892.1 SGNH/GDSL hydrolase family protein [Apilactobacillus micheneri]TPR27750.1 SGNH/GDSL hydrolase family protein [Apilactobacillus micheneri]TPR31655.1 SGNH/GDSL hydrolase family protein [Apilactobacillus micheneri]TPR32059.1 SGNH/GDSL hydrolase family protein [Apilactobacillus micheneri]
MLLFMQNKERKLIMKIAAIGDSVTRGFDGFKDITENYPYYLSQIMHYPVDNFGINGATIKDDLDSEISNVQWKAYQQCILFMGTNDYGHNADKLQSVINELKNCLAFILQTNPDIQITAVLPLTRYDGHQNAAEQVRFANYTFNELLDTLAKTYKKYDIPVLDWRSLYPNFINDDNYQVKYNDQHVHPTAQTYYQIAKKIAKFIKKQ